MKTHVEQTLLLSLIKIKKHTVNYVRDNAR